MYGPTRTVAWRVLDAQYFGLAQRRRRVFVVASARAGFDPLEVLFEREGVRRDTPPRRSQGQDVACTLDARTEGGGFPGTDGAKGGHVVAPPAWPKVYGGNNTSGSINIAPARNACGSASGRMDFESEAFVVSAPLTTNPYGDHESRESLLVLGSNVCQERAVCITGDITHTLKAEGFDASEDGTGRGQPIVICREVAQTLTSSYAKQLDNTNFSLGPSVVTHAIQAGALRENPSSGPDGVGVQAEHAYTLEARAEVQAIQAESAVRRLTPRECERLQGFPDDYTLIPYRNKPASDCPDGPRYKAIGNSKAVPVVRWIGQRLQQQLERSA